MKELSIQEIESLQRADLAAGLSRLKRGQPLTASTRAYLDKLKEDLGPADDPESTAPAAKKRMTYAQIATKWGVTTGTVWGWMQRGLPLQDEKALAQQLLQNKRMPAHIRAKALGVLGNYGAESADDQRAAEEKIERTALGMVEDLEREAAKFQRIQEKAEAAGDIARASIALTERTKLYRHLMIIRKELRKLGEDSGRFLGREEAERIFSAMTDRLSVSVHNTCRHLSTRLLNLNRVEQVNAVMEPELVQTFFLQALVNCAKVTAQCGLPSWVVDCIKKSAGNYIETGEKRFESALNA